MKPVTLCLVLHNHQPVGNFDWVFEKATVEAYEPMVAFLESRPAFRVGLHYSGPLLEWLRECRPAFLGRVRALVERGQVEILGGGYYEPILPAIPERDQLGQLQTMGDRAEAIFGVRPSGAWIAERVWEPHLPDVLARAGVRYTIVDDTHFANAGFTEDAFTGDYLVEENGRTLRVLPGRKKLRYLIPWADPDAVIAWLAAYRAAGAVLTMGDDGEKFGHWPHTHAHVWGENRWMERFADALAAADDWLALRLPTEALDARAPAGLAYLPTASYDEMTEWALPTQASRAFHAARRRLEHSDPEAFSFLRGGFWRNFLVKYQEINLLHKRVLRTSERVHAMRGPGRDAALDHLWRSQCNCPYWHGVFGGSYLPHIRGANWRHAVAAETLAAAELDGTDPAVRFESTDADLDGADELLVESLAQDLWIAPALGGTVLSWCDRRVPANLLDVLTRREEPYHAALREAAARGEIVEAADGAENIHTEHVRVKERGLETVLAYDTRRRVTLTERLVAEDAPLTTAGREASPAIAEFAAVSFNAAVDAAANAITLTGATAGLRLRKELRFVAAEARWFVTYTLEATAPARGWWISEWNFGFPGVRVAEGPPPDADGWREAFNATLSSHERAVTLRWDPPARLFSYDVDSVTNSEAGLERTRQGVCVLLAWLVDLAPDQPVSVTIEASTRPL